jgi:hypothetical protein
MRAVAMASAVRGQYERGGLPAVDRRSAVTDDANRMRVDESGRRGGPDSAGSRQKMQRSDAASRAPSSDGEAGEGGPNRSRDGARVMLRIASTSSPGGQNSTAGRRSARMAWMQRLRRSPHPCRTNGAGYVLDRPEKMRSRRSVSKAWPGRTSGSRRSSTPRGFA